MMGTDTLQAASPQLAHGLAYGLAYVHQRQINMQAWGDELHRTPSTAEKVVRSASWVEQGRQAVFQRLPASGPSNVNTVLK